MSAFLLLACAERKAEPVVTPWGEVQCDSVPEAGGFSLSDIVGNGEMIMLTLSGPETYYDYRGRGMGVQFLLCEKFAQHLGVSLRVELCRDTLDMIERMNGGEGDVIAFMLPKKASGADSLLFCGAGVDSLGVQWAVRSGNRDLAEALDNWYQPSMLTETRAEESRLLSSGSVRRHVYAPFMNRSAGVISRYDDLFRKYAPMARWDWRLMAAQCYQESCFDPQACSWAGARGLMQIMPSTARHLGLSMSDINNPEANISAAARYLQELTAKFGDIPNAAERQNFVLAAYNGGHNHVRDAMALTEKRGGNPRRWADVAANMLLLRNPLYYNDPVVKCGYMRSDETVDYVARINQRYAQYRGVPTGKGFGGASVPVEPRKARKKHRFKL